MADKSITLHKRIIYDLSKIQKALDEIEKTLHYKKDLKTVVEEIQIESLIIRSMVQHIREIISNSERKDS